MINNFEMLIRGCLGPQIIHSVDYSTRPLTVSGDNYGSQILAVEAKIQYKTYKKILYLVAKMCPPNPYLKEVFDSDLTFKKEIAMYSIVIPILKKLQRRQGSRNMLNFFPKYCTSRISLNPDSDVVDDDAILLLKNLKLSGYRVVDSHKGFDLQTTKMVLKNLAVFHAINVGLKLVQPEIFFEIVRFFSRSTVYDGVTSNGKKLIFNIIKNAVKLNKFCEEIILDVIEAMNKCWYNLTCSTPPREPYATIIHNDYWVNNVMLKYKDGKPTNSKIIDFQLMEYGSPGTDITFFLFTSVQLDVLETHYDYLLKWYHKHFIVTLRKLKCDAAPFTFELLKEEINICAKTAQFFHIMVMLKHIFASKEKVKPLSEFTEEVRFSEAAVSDKCRRRMTEVILQFSKRNWI